MESSIYVGTVDHERLTPVHHRFQYPVYMAYIDLAELPQLYRDGILSSRRFAMASFLRQDHFGEASHSLESCVRDHIRDETGLNIDGPIRVLTQLRFFGYYFSPLNVFYCFDRDGKTLTAVVAEVQNTPWKERHCYVLWEGNRDANRNPLNFRHAKVFHVSPFMQMELDYRWTLNVPEKKLFVGIENLKDGDSIFRASLSMKRNPLTKKKLYSLQLRYPMMTARLVLAIHVQAFKLWRKKCRFYPHPKYVQRALDRSIANRSIGQDSSSAFAGKD